MNKHKNGAILFTDVRGVEGPVPPEENGSVGKGAENSNESQRQKGKQEERQGRNRCHSDVRRIIPTFDRVVSVKNKRRVGVGISVFKRLRCCAVECRQQDAIDRHEQERRHQPHRQACCEPTDNGGVLNIFKHLSAQHGWQIPSKPSE